MAYWEATEIILICILSALFSEAISWVLVYRREDYQRLVESVESLGQKLDKVKAEPTDATRAKSHEKKIAAFDEALKAKIRDLGVAKVPSNFVVMLSVLGLFAILSNNYDQSVVAKLPFVPMPLIQGITHRGIAGSDYTDCSFFFLYALCQMAVRSNIVKLLGLSKTSKYDTPASPFGVAPPN